MLDAAKGEFVRIATERGNVMAMPRRGIKTATQETLAGYDIASDRSPDLAPTANASDPN
jgi:hypothetical protein